MSPLLDQKNPSSPSVFRPAALLREARRQKGIQCFGCLRPRPRWRHGAAAAKGRPVKAVRRLALPVTKNVMAGACASRLLTYKNNFAIGLIPSVSKPLHPLAEDVPYCCALASAA